MRCSGRGSIASGSSSSDGGGPWRLKTGGLCEYSPALGGARVAASLRSRPAGYGACQRHREVAHGSGSFPRYDPATRLEAYLDLRGDKGVEPSFVTPLFVLAFGFVARTSEAAVK